MTERELTREIEALEHEKFSLVYDWLKTNKSPNWSSTDYAEGERATAGRRREILDAQRALREQRKALKSSVRAARESSAKERRERKQADRRAITGECQVCEGWQCMTRDGKMVHHGYRRPGHGSIVGDCFGVGHLPYPAVDALRKYSAALDCEERQVAAALEALPGRTEIAEPALHRGAKSIVHSKADTATWKWEALMNGIKYQLEGQARQIKDEQERVRRRIAIVG